MTVGEFGNAPFGMVMVRTEGIFAIQSNVVDIVDVVMKGTVGRKFMVLPVPGFC